MEGDAICRTERSVGVIEAGDVSVEGGGVECEFVLLSSAAERLRAQRHHSQPARYTAYSSHTRDKPITTGRLCEESNKFKCTDSTLYPIE